MPEPTPHRPSRARPGSLAARAAALCAAGVLSISSTLPAAALGEDGAFEFPAETDTLPMVPGAITRIPLVALIEDGMEDEVDLSSAQLALPEGGDEAELSRMVLSEDSRTLEVAGEGTWSLRGTDLVFTPEYGIPGPSGPIAVTIGGAQQGRSFPVVLSPTMLELDEIDGRGSAGAPTTLQLPGTVPEHGAVRLELVGLPAGATTLSDGSRAQVPDQGSWQLSADGTTLTHTPAGPGLGRQLDSIRYVVTGDEGEPVSAGRVTLSVPIISDMDWSAPFGEDILFVVGEGQQHVDPRTLRLRPLGPPESATVSQDGTRALVRDQGTWVLDRSDATVRFTPLDETVHETAPMGISGGDGEGHTAWTAQLSTAYPILRSRSVAGAPGSEISVDLGADSRDVSVESLRFDPDSAPEGAKITEDGTGMTVPGEGTWRIDTATATVVMSPVEELLGEASPVGVIGRGVYADNPVRARVQVVVSPVIATARDDEGRTAVNTPVTVDVLGNDTAGSGAQALTPDTLRISSLLATNLNELEDGRGTRLLIPGEGTFTVGEPGTVTFMPEHGFTGRTTPIVYQIRDSKGIPVRATLAIDVDPDREVAPDPVTEASGINSLLVGLMPGTSGTGVVFGTIVLLLIFGGGVSLWIGLRMESDRRAWED